VVPPTSTSDCPNVRRPAACRPRAWFRSRPLATPRPRPRRPRPPRQRPRPFRLPPARLLRPRLTLNPRFRLRLNPRPSL